MARQWAKLIDGALFYAPHTLTVNDITYCPPTEAVCEACGYKPITYSPAPEGENAYTSTWVERDEDIVRVWELVEITPAEHRERAYETRLCCEWHDELYTVDSMVEMYSRYAAEGSEKCVEIREIIAEAKAQIREDYPDE